MCVGKALGLRPGGQNPFRLIFKCNFGVILLLFYILKQFTIRDDLSWNHRSIKIFPDFRNHYKIQEQHNFLREYHDNCVFENFGGEEEADDRIREAFNGDVPAFLKGYKGDLTNEDSLKIAQEYFKNGEISLASEICEQVRSNNPKYFVCHHIWMKLLTEIYINRKLFKSLKKVYVQAISVGDDRAVCRATALMIGLKIPRGKFDQYEMVDMIIDVDAERILKALLGQLAKGDTRYDFIIEALVKKSDTLRENVDHLYKLIDEVLQGQMEKEKLVMKKQICLFFQKSNIWGRRDEDVFDFWFGHLQTCADVKIPVYYDMRDPLYGYWYNEKLERVWICKDGFVKAKTSKHVTKTSNIWKFVQTGASGLRIIGAGKTIDGIIAQDGDTIGWNNGTEWIKAYEGVRPKGHKWEAFYTDTGTNKQKYVGTYESPRSAAIARGNAFRKSACAQLKKIKFLTEEEKNIIANQSAGVNYCRNKGFAYLLILRKSLFAHLEERV